MTTADAVVFYLATSYQSLATSRQYFAPPSFEEGSDCLKLNFSWFYKFTIANCWRLATGDRRLF
jgi:hypothetical protein